MKIKKWLETRSDWGVSRNELEIILSKISGLSRTELILHEDKNLINDEKLKELDTLVKKRASGTPMAYVMGYREFYGREFFVNEQVLIPRPETETMIDIVKRIAEKDFPRKSLKIVDVGTGSGCIAVTLKLELPDAEVLAVDNSVGALAIARKNAEELNADVKFLKSSLLEQVEGRCDIIVANLPYVDINWDWIDQKELAQEPKNALYAEDGGLALIFELIDQVVERAEHGAYLVLESDPSQQGRLAEYAVGAGMRIICRDGYISAFQYLGA